MQLLHQSRGLPRPVGLEHLPLELLYEILVLSRSDSFAIASRTLRTVFQDATVADRVDYIMARWMDRYVAHRIAHPCRAKHKACRKQASRAVSLWRDRDPAWRDFVSTLSVLACETDALRTEKLDVVTFASEIGMCTVQVLERLVASAAAAGLPRALLGAYLRSDTAEGPSAVHEAWERLEVPQPQLPKRLFRHIEHYGYAEPADRSSGDERSKKRRRRRNTDTKSHDAVDDVSPGGSYPAWLSKLLVSLAAPQSAAPQVSDKTQNMKTGWLNEKVEAKRARAPQEQDDIKSIVGLVPSAEELEMILVLLYRYGADSSSHRGYPLAMAVHRGSYSLVHLLLLFGADPGCKNGLAVQIAIRNGNLELLRLLISGPCINHDLTNLLPLEAPSTPPQLGSPAFQLDHAHLRLAIQCKHWHLVDFIWHDQKVPPDLVCLRLLDELES